MLSGQGCANVRGRICVEDVFKSGLFFFKWARTQCIFLLQTVGICLVWEKSAITHHHSGVTRAISTVICALYPYAEAVGC